MGESSNVLRYYNNTIILFYISNYNELQDENNNDWAIDNNLNNRQKAGKSYLVI